MSGWLDKFFSKRTAERSERENPLLAATVKKSSEVYQQTPLASLLDSETSEELSRSLFLEINEICNATDPLATCRQKLATAMIRYASYQVLVIPPLPEPDPSGLRLQPGITGGLKQNILKIAQCNPGLRSELFGVLQQPDEDSVWKAIEKSFWIALWRLETIDAARLGLGDDGGGRDWYPAFRHAACASAEGNYRREADLPSAFDPAIAATAPTAYAIFTDIVVAGESEPEQAWQEYHAGSNIPSPNS